MTEIKHTPGPFFTTSPHGRTIYIEARLRGSTIQEVAAIGPTEAPEQQQANAKLFAAAPELLEALTKCLSLKGTLELHGLLGEVEAAIAKATQ